jgi:hypothetical protein
VDLDGYYVGYIDNFNSFFKTEIVEIRSEKVYLSRYPDDPASFMHFHIGTVELRHNTVHIAIDTTLIISLNTGGCSSVKIGCGYTRTYNIYASGNLVRDCKTSYLDPASHEMVIDVTVKCELTKVDDPGRNVNWPKLYLSRGGCEPGDCNTTLD